MPMDQPATPPGTVPPAAGTTLVPPAGPAMAPPADLKPLTPLARPTPMAPVVPNGHPAPVAAWAGIQQDHPAGPFSTLAQSYNVPMHSPQTWGSVEYLLWWVKPGPVSVPLVNTTIVPENLANSIAAGGITDPLARTVFGNESVNFDSSSGVRFTVGSWLDGCQENGFEGSMFFLPRQSKGQTFTGGTGAAGQPALTVPFNSVGPGPVIGETSAAIAGPFATATIVGTITERMTTDFWGGDADMLFNMWKGEFWRFDAIAGFKYLNLNETFDFTTAVRTPPFGSTDDQFRTSNHFYGGELGGRVTAQMDRVGFQLTGKVGLGDNVETVDLRGTSVAPTDFGGTFGPGGLFTQSSNIGKTERGRFSAVPQVNGTISYDVNCHLKAYAGYNFIYWANVVRPGDQIDRNINPNLAAVFGGSAAGTGSPQPTRLMRETDFWAHGVSLGLSMTW
jgi:hypothetical protein